MFSVPNNIKLISNNIKLISKVGVVVIKQGKATALGQPGQHEELKDKHLIHY